MSYKDSYKLFHAPTTQDEKIQFIKDQISKYHARVDVDSRVPIDENKLLHSLTSDFVSYFIPKITDDNRPMKVEIEVRKFWFWWKL